MGISKEAEVSIAASSMFPGFRFSPTDEELILFYLKKKVDGFSQSVEVINEVDICKHEPWDLPAKSIIKSDHEWFFFSPRGKKYPNGSQSKRATEIGYWKATGKERAVKSGSDQIGTKRTLVFHIGRAPKGERTEWIMHEYCLSGNPQDSLVICRLRRKSDSLGNISTSWEVGNNSNPSLPEVDGASSGSGAVPCCSHDSHSVEQNAYASESGQKMRDEGTEPESSSQPKGSANFEDDCFADILKDNIIELDESALPARRSEVGKSEGTYGPPVQPFMSQINISQGTANRRIRLKKLTVEMQRSKRGEQTGENEVGGGSGKKRSAEHKGLKLLMRCRKATNKLYVVMTISGVAAMVLLVLGSPWLGLCSCSAP